MKCFTLPTAAAVLLLFGCFAHSFALPSRATFYGAQNFGTNRGGPFVVEGGDFDGDGRTDAVGGYPGGITVHFGDTVGGFLLPYLQLYEPSIGGDFYFPYTGDINGDGLTDIAVRRRNLSNAWSLAVYIGKADRTFSTAVFSNFSDVAEYLQVLDIDGDGKADIVGSGYSNNIGNFVAVYKGDGTGSFTAGPQFLSANYVVPIVASFNGDSLPDIMFADGSVDKISINSGGGQFAAPVLINNGSPIHPSGTGDFNGDGIRDLVAVSGATSPSNQIWLGTGNLNFTLANSLQIPSHASVFLKAVTDLDGDAKDDLIFNTYNRILIRKGVGNGTFSDPIIYGEGGNGGLFVRDTNADGQPDIVTAQPVEWGYSGSASISVMNNQGGMSFRSAPVFSTGNGTRDIATADLDADGLVDMVIVNTTGGSSPGNTLILYQSTTAGFSEMSGLGPSKAAAVAGVDPYGVRVGDLNLDGKPDIVVYGAPVGGGTQNLLIFLNLGGRAFNSSFAQIGTGTLYGMSLEDINGDGKLDVAAAGYDGILTSLGSGTGTFGTATQYLTGVANSSIATGDVNGDGSADIAAVSYNISKIAVLVNNGSGSFTNIANIALGGSPSAVALGKMNGDGLNDIVLAKGTGVSVLMSNGDGTFGTEAVYAITPVSATRLTLADLNGDGKTDVATAAGTNVASVLVNNGFGGLGQETVWSAGVTIAAITSGDIDGDDRTDLLTGYTASQEGYMKILFNTTVPSNSLTRVFCDFDGDAKTDLSIFRPAQGEWWYLKSSTGGNAAAQFGSSTDTIVPGDYTGDGKTDIAFFRPSTGFWYVLRSDDLTFYAFPFGGSGDVPAPADYDADGKADAAVFRPSTATWYISKSTGGTTIQQFGLTTDKPVAADYDGDGKADIAVYRPTGANGAEWWIMKSSGGVFATQFGSATDKAVPADYTGDGKADVAFWIPSTGQWFILRSEDLTYYAFPFGGSGDSPVPGDYDGDGKADAAVFRPSNSTWYANKSGGGTLIQQFGSAGDIAVPNAFIR